MTTENTSSGPVVVTAAFYPMDGAHDDVLAALTEAVPLVHDEQGCELYSVQRRSDGSFFMIETWTNVDLLDQHGSSAAVRALVSCISDLLVRPVEVERLTPIPLGSPDKGAL
jgi:quinol monooxygenase YgiN